MIDYDEFVKGTEVTSTSKSYDAFVEGCNLPAISVKELVPDKNLWCLCEIHDGELPSVRAYSNLEDLIKAFRTKENTDSFVWIFYGQPLQFTKPIKTQKGSGIRYLMLPEGKAVSVTKDMITIDQSLLDIGSQVEQTGWMGDLSIFNNKQFFVEGYLDE